ncbi:cuticle protein AM1274-like isoform X2 [Oratosquilla oratoria]|uniref:cuticle protein AM1274-like isoform X2 n=1 Tax=Oratosquilla oratoria TaxID=337810 RepID=UPI003F76B577
MAARIALFSLLVCSAAAQQLFGRQQFVSEPRFRQTPFVEILRAESAGPEPDGSYAFRFEDSAGSRREEVAQATGPNTFAVEGSYSYTNEDGSVVEVRYRADENGYQPESPYLPVAPPMPAHALEQIRIAEEQKRQGIVFDERGFVVGQQRGQGSFNQQQNFNQPQTFTRNRFNQQQNFNQQQRFNQQGFQGSFSG